MIAYASRTGTRRNLAMLRSHGWRLMVSARGVLRTEGFRYCLDNGAWTAFQKGEPFDVSAFERAYEMLARNADFVVLPDIVGGGTASLEMSMAWLRRLQPVHCLPLLAVQDGMAVEDVAPLVGLHMGIFVGGSTEWKERTIPEWSALARQRSAWCHVGRVNSVRRIYQCAGAGVTSFDGTSASRFSVTTRKLDNARRQMDFMVG